MSGLQTIVDGWMDDERLGCPLSSISLEECIDAEMLTVDIFDVIEAVNDEMDEITDENGNTVEISYTTESVSMFIHGEQYRIEELSAIFKDSIELLERIEVRESFEFTYEDAGLTVECTEDDVIVTAPTNKLNIVEEYFDNLLEFSGFNLSLTVKDSK